MSGPKGLRGITDKKYREVVAEFIRKYNLQASPTKQAVKLYTEDGRFVCNAHWTPSSRNSWHKIGCDLSRRLSAMGISPGA